MAIVGVREEFLLLKLSRLSKTNEPAEPIVNHIFLEKIKTFCEKYFAEKNQDIIVDVIQK